MSNLSAEFLTKLFYDLNRENIIYCVLRNYENLPETTGHDVDIWVKPEDGEKFRKVLLDNALNAGWEHIGYIPWPNRHGEGSYHFANFNGDLQILLIDCAIEMHCRGLIYLEDKLIIDSRKLYKNLFYVSSPGVEASSILFPWLIRTGKIRDKDRIRLNGCIKDAESFFTVLNRSVGSNLAECLYSAIESGDWEKLSKKRNAVWFSLFKNSLIRNKIIQLKELFLYIYDRIKTHFFVNQGIFMAILGPDGAGKTTIANKVLESKIKNLFFSPKYMYFRFAFMPGLSKIKSFFTGKNNESGRGIILDNFKQFSPLRAVMYPLYYSIDYLLGYFFVYRKMAYRSLVVFDRYFYDYAAQ